MKENKFFGLTNLKVKDILGGGGGLLFLHKLIENYDINISLWSKELYLQEAL